MAGQFAHFAGGHGPDMRKRRIDHRVALPEEHAVVVGGRAGADVFLRPSILAVEGVGAICAARVLEAQRAHAEGLAFALVGHGGAAGKVVLLEGGCVGRIGLRGIGEGLGRRCLHPAVKSARAAARRARAGASQA